MSDLRRGRHGIAGIELVKVTSHGDRDDLRDLVIDIELEGDFGAAYAAGGEASVASAESLRNVVHALAPRHGSDEIETFALALTHHLVLDDAAVQHAVARIVERPWTRATLAHRPRGRTFLRGGSERRVAIAARTRAGEVRLDAGVIGLEVAWADAPPFGGRRPDRYAAGPPRALFVLGIDALWRYGWPEVPFAVQWRQSRASLLAALSEQRFASAQEAAHGLARAVLEQAPVVSEARITVSVRRHVEADLSAFGVESTGEVFCGARDGVERVEAEVRRMELETDG